MEIWFFFLFRFEKCEKYLGCCANLQVEGQFFCRTCIVQATGSPALQKPFGNSSIALARLDALQPANGAKFYKSEFCENNCLPLQNQDMTFSPLTSLKLRIASLGLRMVDHKNHVSEAAWDLNTFRENWKTSSKTAASGNCQFSATPTPRIQKFGTHQPAE